MDMDTVIWIIGWLITCLILAVGHRFGWWAKDEGASAFIAIMFGVFGVCLWPLYYTLFPAIFFLFTFFEWIGKRRPK